MRTTIIFLSRLLLLIIPACLLVWGGYEWGKPGDADVGFKWFYAIAWLGYAMLRILLFFCALIAAGLGILRK